MRILQLGKFYPIKGGVEKVMWDLTRGLSAAGYECDMLCASFDGAKEMEILRCAQNDSGAQNDREAQNSEAKNAGRCIVLPCRFQASGTMICPEMIGWLREHNAQYDIIHIHHPDPMACLALRMSGYKGRVVLHWHSDILKNKAVMAAYNPLQNWLIRRADKIVGTTPVYVAQSPALKDVQDKVTYVPIGIEPIELEPEKADEIQARYPGKKIVYSLGRLVPYKGFTYLVQAAKFLPEDYVVLIGGTGPLKDGLQKEIEVQGLQDKVKLLGFIPDEEHAALYGAAKVFVLSSVMKTEAFGIVQIEAMSCGKPVVATRIPESGVSWVNEDGVSGLNVETENPESLADAIVRICEDDEKYVNFASGSLNRYKTLFSFEAMIKNILTVYENLQ